MHSTNTWEQVDHYISERLIPHDAVLEKVLATNQQAGLPPHDVSPNQGKLLNILAQMQGARRVLEIGTLGGYSTIWLGRALPTDGKIVTLEAHPVHAKIARSNISLAQLDGMVELREGDALEQLTQMKDESVAPFDLIFIDADKPNNPLYLEWALRFSRSGTVIIGDNVVREGEIIQAYSTDPRVQGVRKFYDLLAEESRITATAIQTVGSKGYDGFVIGIVKE
ncbi:MULTISPECIES: O-methyltransferase [Paenibacillus]|uniref:O-methyltransferase n=1 Tax=Paenibacillus TaxID=44249 RepID=UPI000589B9EB|nr:MULTISPECIES: O-methyltransferase [Paenibacillus]AJE50226.1 methyltransferase [Paenibacillus polymyxa]AZH28833.1 O-methyltransferase [Paenibacillus sp. M-152]MBU9708167.1 O-methyltransferase [Paenibacillus sp. AK121]MEE4568403.1 O-methyltransferase [Paenibacillus polymyxa]QOH61394.1 O-methyltransferase [Paenibacillus polymyxa]